MVEIALIGARFVQYLAAALLLGAPAFRIYGLPGPARPGERRWLPCAALALTLGATLALAAQAAVMTGSSEAALQPAVWWTVATATQVGQATAVRAICGIAAALLLLGGRRAERPWAALVLIGCVATASFAWSGHAGAGEGAAGLVQLVADSLHVLGATLWLGAVLGMGLALEAIRREPPATRLPLVKALEGFAGVGSVLVALIVVTGLINTWMLAPPDQFAGLLDSTYGALLGVKLGLFAVMLGCAATNRLGITPALRADRRGDAQSVRSLRLSLAAEASAGALVLVVVAWLGTLSPPG